MHGIRYAEGMKVLPLTAPVAFTTTAVESKYVDMNEAHWATFLVMFGVMTSDSTDTVTITVEASTEASSNATEVTMAFSYRLSSAVDTDSMGAITAATTTGVAVTASADDSKMLIIDVNPSNVAAEGADYRFLRVVATPSDAVAAGVISIVAVLESRYPGNSIPSST